MNIQMKITAILLVILLVAPNAAFACSPPPWSFESIYNDGTKAVVYGTVTSVSTNKRKATIEVKKIVGPGSAPKMIDLPSTKDSRSKNDECPDFSDRFDKGKDYIIFLKNIYPVVELTHSDWKTSLPIDENHNITVNLKNETVKVDMFLNNLSKDSEIKTPDKDSKYWRENNGHYTIYIIGGGLVAILFFLMRKVFKYRNSRL